MLAQAHPVLTFERAQFFNPTLKSGPIKLTSALEFGHLHLGVGEQLLCLNLRLSRVFLGSALSHRQNRHCLLVDVLDGCRSDRSYYRRSWSGRSRCTRWDSLLGCGEPATEFGVLTLERTELEFDLVEEGIDLVHLVAALALGGRELLIADVLGCQGHRDHTFKSRWAVVTDT